MWPLKCEKKQPIYNLSIVQEPSLKWLISKMFHNPPYLSTCSVRWKPLKDKVSLTYFFMYSTAQQSYPIMWKKTLNWTERRLCLLNLDRSKWLPSTDGPCEDVMCKTSTVICCVFTKMHGNNAPFDHLWHKRSNSVLTRVFFFFFNLKSTLKFIAILRESSKIVYLLTTFTT